MRMCWISLGQKHDRKRECYNPNHHNHTLVMQGPYLSNA